MTEDRSETTRRRKQSAVGFWRRGDLFLWLTGGATALSLILIGGLLAIVAANGFGYFLPRPLVELRLADGSRRLGEIVGREARPEGDHRLHLKRGNRDLYGIDFEWVDEAEIVRRSRPKEAVLVERMEWGNFYGSLLEYQDGEEVFPVDATHFETVVARALSEAGRLRAEESRIEKRISKMNGRIARLRDRIRKIEYREGSRPSASRRIAALEAEIAAIEKAYAVEAAQLDAISEQADQRLFRFVSIDGQTVDLPTTRVVRLYRPNRLGFGGRLRLFAARVWEFVFAAPREANTEGGVFPAIFGTVTLVMLMSIAVVPLGVVAALYLREYAVQGPVIRLVRIAVNNLAGVPSIVYGVFGVGFFIYTVGGGIDRFFFPERLPTPTYGTGGILWASLTLALLTLPVVIVSTEEALASVPRSWREASLALGATQFQTVWRVLLPVTTPGILTGLILAVARAAGEVAPLMITGAVKLAPALPIDGQFPFLHLNRQFMHLGFHIYDVGFQSPNVEAAKPILFATALLLLVLVVVLNLTALLLRNSLRKRFDTGAF